MFSAIVASTLLQGQLEAVKESLKKMGVIEFAYEGEYKRLDGVKGRSPIERRFVFSGDLKITPALCLVETEHRQPSPNGFVVSKTSFSPEQSIHMATLDGRKSASGDKTEPGGYGATTGSGHPLWNWFPSASLLVANNAEAASFSIEGEKTAHGRRCSVVVHRLKGSVDEAKYWVDLERNGIVLAKEFWRGGVFISMMTAKDIRQYKAKNGRTVWLPSVIVHEQYAKHPSDAETWVMELKPWNRSTTRIIPESVKLDEEASKIEEVKPWKEPQTKAGRI